MRVLAVADIHGALDVYEWLTKIAGRERVDAVIIAGDLFSGGWEEEQAVQAKEIISLLQAIPAPVFYLMGNDDHIPLSCDDEKMQLLHGRRIELGRDFAIAGYQFTPLFMGTVFERSEDEIAADTQWVEPLLDERTVFVTHGPVYGVLDRTYGGQRVGSRSLAALLQRRPVLAHIHGHIHESFGRDGNRFNVASAARRRAMLVELPSLESRVVAE